MNAYKDVVNATILAGESLSDLVTVRGYDIVGLYIPSWTTASITFKGGVNTTVGDVYKSGVEYTISGVAGYISIPAEDLAGVTWLQIRSGTSSAPVTQAATRTIGVIIRD